MANEKNRNRNITTTAAADAAEHGEVLADAETGEVRELTTLPAEDGIIAADLAARVNAKFREEQWSQERTFWVGSPEAANPKVPLYMGEMVGPGPQIEINDMNAEKEESGDWKKRPIETYMFHPLNVQTLQPNYKILDTMICNHQVLSACRRYEALGKAKGKKVRMFVQWNGKRETRMGRQMNDVDTKYVLVDPNVVDVEAAPTPPTGAGDGAKG